MNLKFWKKRPKAEPEPLPGGLTITDGRYGRLEHLLSYDPDDYGWRGKSLEEMHRIFHTPVSPAQRYGFHDLTLEDFEHAFTGAYKGEPNG